MDVVVNTMYYTKSSACVTSHKFYLDTAIQYTEVYREFIDTLLNVPEQDEVHIYINTPGGSCSIGINIVNAMRNCKAKIIGHLMSECHSMGTFIFLECDEFVVNEDILLLFHAYSGWNFGKGNDTVISAQKNHEWLSKFFRKVYYPFFTMEEIDEIMPADGKGATDYYLGYSDMLERLDKVIEYRGEMNKLADAEHVEMIKKALNDEEIKPEDSETLHTPTS